MAVLKCGLHCQHVAIGDFDTAVCAFIADVDGHLAQDFAVNALRTQIGFGFGGQFPDARGERFGIHRAAIALLPDGPPVGKAHAIGRQYARQRVDHHLIHTQRIGNQTGMLAASPAKAGQRVTRDIMPAFDRDFLDRIGHVGHRNGDKAFRDFFRA